jgi:hypothetical protein
MSDAPAVSNRDRLLAALNVLKRGSTTYGATLVTGDKNEALLGASMATDGYTGVLAAFAAEVRRLTEGTEGADA